MLAIIGGSGLSRIGGLRQESFQRVSTPYGEPSAPLVSGLLGGCRVVFLPRHGDPHNVPPHRINYRANIEALSQAGARCVLAINTVGGINPGMRSGDLVVPHDVIDYTWGREHTFSDGMPGSRLDHVDFTRPFDDGMRGLLIDCLREAEVRFHEAGVYAAAQGPRLESPAEIRRFERDGCDLVGMTGMPEAALARERGLRYAMLCLVVNPAAGKGDGPISLDDIRRVMDEGMSRVAGVMARFGSRLQGNETSTSAPKSG